MQFSGEDKFRERGTAHADAEEGACVANSGNRKEAGVQARWVVVGGQVTALTRGEVLQSSTDPWEDFGVTLSKMGACRGFQAEE